MGGNKEKSDVEAVDEDSVKVDSSASIDVIETDKLISDFLLKDEFFRNRFLGAEGQRADIAFRNVLVRFDSYVEKMGLGDAPFFSLDVAKKDFVDRFKYFMVDIDNRVVGLCEDLKIHAGLHDFDVGWELLIKEVCYYAFFVHYGSKRRDQKDYLHRPQDYVYHVVRTAFDKLIKVVGLPKLKHFITAILHDSREDFQKGIAAILNSSKGQLAAFYRIDSQCLDASSYLKEGEAKAKKMKVPIIEEMKDNENDFNMRLNQNPETELSLTESVDIVTKGGSNRDIAFLEILSKVLKHRGPKFVDAITVMLVKISDRLENTESEDREKNRNQTRFAYLPLCVDMGMWGSLDAFYDLLYMVDYDFRVKWKALLDITDIDEGGDVPVTQEFCDEFDSRIRKIPGCENLVFGVDYVIKYRPVGIRYSNYDDALEMTASGEYTKAFRNYVIFYPVKKDKKIERAGIEVFKLIFDQHLDGDKEGDFKRPELRNLYGRAALASRGGVDLDKHGYSDKYGVGIWGVAKSRCSAVRRLDGDPHLVSFYNGGDVNFAQERMVAVFDQIEPDVDRLLRQYQIFIDADKSRMSGKKVVNDVVHNVLSKISGIFSSEQSSSIDVKTFDSVSNFLEVDSAAQKYWPSKFIAMLGALVMSIFMKKDREVEVVIDGRTHEFSLPVGVDDMDAIVWAEPLMVGRKFTYNVLITKGKKRIIFEVEDKYDYVLADRQLADLQVLLDNYRDNLLEDDMRKKRGSKLTGKPRDRVMFITGGHRKPKS